MPDVHLLDLDAYRQRIGFEGAMAPTLDVLRNLAEHHARTIPFENLSVVLGHGVDLSVPVLEQKLVHDQRGGYCFEQNGLMLAVLRQIGFDVTPLAGRVRLEQPRTYLPPRTHLFLSVDIEGEAWIFDVGVGAYSLTSPIRRHAEGEQPTLHETRRILHEEGKCFHQVLRGDEWIDVYEFTGEIMTPIDAEVGNWWTSTSPRSKFSQNLVCARSAENGERMAIANDRFLRRKGGIIVEEVTLVSADHILDVLAERFGIRMPPGTRFGSGPRPWPTV